MTVIKKKNLLVQRMAFLVLWEIHCYGYKNSTFDDMHECVHASKAVISCWNPPFLLLQPLMQEKVGKQN